MHGRGALIATMLSLLSFLALGGCGEDGDDPLAPGGGSGGVEIGPAGGTFLFASGRVTLAVPAGALAATVEVAVDDLASPPGDPGLVASACFVCEPEALSFAVPATLTIAYDEDDLPAGVAETTLRAHRLDGGVWQMVGGGTADPAGDVVTASIDALGRFGVLGTVAAEGPVYEGSYVITDAASLAAFAGHVGITGDLEIASYAPETVVVEDLETIGGKLKLFGPAQAPHTLRSASLPALRSIGGLLQIENCDSLRTLDLPVCTEVGAVDVRRNHALADLDGLDALAALDPLQLPYHGSIGIWWNDGLADLDGLRHLTGRARSITVRENPALASVGGLGGLSFLDGDLEIADCGALTTLDGLGLRTIAGSCIVRSCLQLADLTGLDLLTSVGAYLQVEGCPQLADLTGLGQLGSCGLLAVQFNQGLVSLEGLGPLQQVTTSSLILVSNPDLEDIGALEFLTRVQANLQIEGCPKLASLAGLEALTHVGGDLRLDSLHALTDLDALAQLDHAWGHLRIRNCVHLESVQGLWGLQANPATGYVCRSFYVVDNAQAGSPGSGLSNAKAEELLAMIGGAAMVEGTVTIEGN